MLLLHQDQLGAKLLAGLTSVLDARILALSTNAGHWTTVFVLSPPDISFPNLFTVDIGCTAPSQSTLRPLASRASCRHSRPSPEPWTKAAASLVPGVAPGSYWICHPQEQKPGGPAARVGLSTTASLPALVSREAWGHSEAKGSFREGAHESQRCSALRSGRGKAHDCPYLCHDKLMVGSRSEI